MQIIFIDLCMYLCRGGGEDNEKNKRKSINLQV